MKFGGWLLFLLGLIIATGVFGVGLYYHEIFFSICVALSLVLTTEKVRHVIQANKAKIVVERRVVYGILLVFFWIAGAVLFVVSATELAEVVNVLVEGDINSVDSFISMAKEKLPATVSNQLFEPSRMEALQSYIKGYMIRLQDETVFLVWYVPILLPLTILAYWMRRRLIWILMCFLPEKCHDGFMTTVRNTRAKLYDFIGAKALESLAVGIISATGFILAGLPGGFILGMLAGAFNIVPYIGPLIGLIPPVMLTLLQGDVVMTFNVLATILLAQLIDNFYLIPFMISDKVSLNPVLAIGLALVGSQFYGALGLFFSIPVYVAYESAVFSWYQAMQESYGTGAYMETYVPEEKIDE